MTEADGKLRARPCTRYRRRPVRRLVRGTPVGAWNIAVRTRGVFTHRDDFLGPACVERGLVRPGISPISNSRCELVLAILLPSGQPPSPAAAFAPSARTRCEPNRAKPLLSGPSPCLAWLSAASALPGMSRFRRIGSHLRRVTQAPGPALWQRAPGNRQPPAMLLC